MPLSALLADEIRSQGPIPFSRFMEVALYHPNDGYYSNPAHDPFGREGDFYTASQLQPVFGRLIAAALHQLRSTLPSGEPFTVVEWGAGRGELAPYLTAFDYHAVDAGPRIHTSPAPASFQGAVFSNELFDALPVDAVRLHGDNVHTMLVAHDGARFHWCEGPPPAPHWLDYIETLRPHLHPGHNEHWLELPVRLDETLRLMSAPLTRGSIITIDYGYTAREILRTPRGTLMGYHHHRAIEDVLEAPGLRDITAHLPFTYLEHSARSLGLRPRPLESMTRFLMRAGEPDQFASALEAPDEAAAQRLRLQLKTLLFGMGETFRVAIFDR